MTKKRGNNFLAFEVQCGNTYIYVRIQAQWFKRSPCERTHITFTTMKWYVVNFYFLTFFAKTVKTLMIPSEDLLVKMHEHGMFNRINFISKEESTRNDLR